MKADRTLATGSPGNLRAYTPLPPATGFAPRQLAVSSGGSRDERYTFYDRLEIGRYHAGRKPPPGVLLVADPTVSSRHCIITQTPDGRCFVRDTSRNGTRLLGRRLVPNVEVELEAGQVLTLGQGLELRLEDSGAALESKTASRSTTVTTSPVTVVTVVVGDIRDYTGLVQRTGSREVSAAVGRLFALLEREVLAHGGTVKEYQGDAVVAFWEEGDERNQAAQACQGAVALDRLVRKLAKDPRVWSIRDFPLRMDWALATGAVTVGALGMGQPTALAMVGAPVVRAFRLEELAEETGSRILACATTRERARDCFRFRSHGNRRPRGFDGPEEIFALLGPRRMRGLGR